MSDLCDLREHFARKAAQRLRKRIKEERCATCNHRRLHHDGDGPCSAHDGRPCTCKRYKALVNP